MIYYFDNCATTRADDEVVEILTKYHTACYFNPSALNSFSAKVAADIGNARQTIAKTVGVACDELIFTSGGTESNNTAILGCLKKKQGNIILSQTDHSATYNCATILKNRGFEIRIANSLSDGHIDIEHYLSLVDSNTLLAVVTHVNNETGAINDIKYLCESIKSRNPNTLVFADGVQAVGKVAVNLKYLGIDLYSISGHKIHCTKGIGCLYVKKGIKLSPLLVGGGQEHNIRSGTEYVGGIISLSFSIEKAVQLREENSQKFKQFKNLINSALSEIGNCKIVCADNCADGILSVGFAGIKSEVLVHMLEEFGIVVGTGSACSSKAKHNRIFDAIGLPIKYADGTIRISFSKYTDQSQVVYLCEKLKQCVSQLRKLKI